MSSAVVSRNEGEPSVRSRSIVGRPPSALMLGVSGLLLLLLLVPGFASAELPDGRVYEQVTPVDKHGADVLPNPQRTPAAVGGSAVGFASLEGFGDIRGFGVSTDYVARRGGDGSWATHAITPPQEPSDLALAILAGFEPRYMLFSDDLSNGAFLARSPLTDAPNVAGVINMYTRDDVLEAGAGSYELLTDAASPQTFDFQIPWVAGASEDFSHVIFESKRNLTADTAGLDSNQPKLYEQVDGSVRLAGVLPDDEGGGPTVSQAGQGALNKLPVAGAISRDGRRVVFTVPISSGEGEGVVYLRDDQGTSSVADDESVRVGASERTDCNDDPSCGGDGIPDLTPDPANPGGVAPPATFWAATADGSQVFFTTSEQLTDDDINQSIDLYRFDLDASAGSRLIRLSVDEEPSDNPGADLHNGRNVTGVMGASEDGSYVYFIVEQEEQLVAGGPTGGTGSPGNGERIFVWHDGALRHVGAINGGDSLELLRIVGSDGVSPRWSRVTPDGARLVFMTQGTEELLSLYGRPEYDHGSSCPDLSANECREVYVYDATANSGEGDMQCASCNPTGRPATVDADLYGGVLERGGSASTLYLNRSVTDDGRFVFFNTAERLLPDDENTAIDAYEFDTETGRAHLISTGQGSGDQLFMDASADGSDVFFTSREQLRSTDRDQSSDLYDARIGGVPDPGVTEVVRCSGEGCRGPRSAAPGLAKPGSDGFDGVGNVSGGARSTISGIRKLSLSDRLTLAKGGKARLRLRVNRAGRVTLAGRARVGNRSRRVASSLTRAKKAGQVSIAFALSRGARAELGRKGSLTVRLTVRFRDARPKVVAVTLRASAKGKGGAR